MEAEQTVPGSAHVAAAAVGTCVHPAVPQAVCMVANVQPLTGVPAVEPLPEQSAIKWLIRKLGMAAQSRLPSASVSVV